MLAPSRMADFLCQRDVRVAQCPGCRARFRIDLCGSRIFEASAYCRARPFEILSYLFLLFAHSCYTYLSRRIRYRSSCLFRLTALLANTSTLRSAVNLHQRSNTSWNKAQLSGSMTPKVSVS